MSDYSQSYIDLDRGDGRPVLRGDHGLRRLPALASPITECQILDRHPDGLARRVAFALDMKLKTVRYVLEYSYEPPHTLRWRMVEGDLKAVEGTYRFEEANGQTQATGRSAAAVAVRTWKNVRACWGEPRLGRDLARILLAAHTAGDCEFVVTAGVAPTAPCVRRGRADRYGLQ